MARKVLLSCGILSSLLYVAMNVLAAMRYEGYRSASQTISELSAIGAPSRPLWVGLGIVYTLLVAAFGGGVWRSAGTNRRLRVVGALFVANGLIGLAWPPMHPRGTVVTLTDTVHIVFTMVTVLLMMLAIGFGAGALGRRFRLYSLATLVILVSLGEFFEDEIASPLELEFYIRLPESIPNSRLAVIEQANPLEMLARFPFPLMLAAMNPRSAIYRTNRMGGVTGDARDLALRGAIPEESVHRFVDESSPTLTTVG